MRPECIPGVFCTGTRLAGSVSRGTPFLCEKTAFRRLPVDRCLMKPTTAEIHRALYGSAGKGNWNGETQLVKSIQAYLRLIGCPSFRRNVGALEVADAGGK